MDSMRNSPIWMSNWHFSQNRLAKHCRAGRTSGCLTDRVISQQANFQSLPQQTPCAHFSRELISPGRNRGGKNTLQSLPKVELGGRRCILPFPDPICVSSMSRIPLPQGFSGENSLNQTVDGRCNMMAEMGSDAGSPSITGMINFRLFFAQR